MSEDTLVALAKVGALLVAWIAVLSVFGRTLNQILRAKFLDKPRDARTKEEAVWTMEARDSGPTPPAR